ncbi:hypothetical protein [Actinotignum sp. GS-2025e]|uniref:hypothetical protein n=1 Tax=Actinotignum sp. GS-2025e TaxID=3427278 RepID=UPI003F47392C
MSSADTRVTGSRATDRPAARTNATHIRTGNRAMLRYDLRRLLRVPSTWVVLGLALLLAVVSPLTALYAPDIIAALAGPDTAAALGAAMPEPTWIQAHAQWLKNVHQIFGMLFVMLGAYQIVTGMLGGPVVLIVTRSVSRTAVFAGKMLSTVLLVAAVAFGGSTVAGILTRILFDDGAVLALLGAAALWLLAIIFLLSVVVLAAVATGNMLASAGIGFVAYLVLAFGGMWEAGARYSPLGLNDAVGAVASGAEVPGLWWIGTTTALAACALLWLALRLYQRRPLG